MPRTSVTKSIAIGFLLFFFILSAASLRAKKSFLPVLVNVKTQDRSLIVNMPYATKKNFAGKKLYDASVCLLRPEVAGSLVSAQKEFKQWGCSLEMLDCYRPKSVSMRMWQIGVEHNRKCRAMGRACRSGGCNPAQPTCLWEPLTNYMSRASKHNRGASVDVTLVCNGLELVMGTPYDYFGPAARTRNTKGGYLKNRLYLKTVMERHGFKNYFREWWHYDHASYKKYAPLDAPLTGAVKKY